VTLLGRDRHRRFELRFQRRAGEWIARQPKAKGERGQFKPKSGGNSVLPPTEAPTLADLGIEKIDASRWQKLAAVPEHAFEAYVKDSVASGKAPTASGARRLVEPEKTKPEAPPKIIPIKPGQDPTTGEYPEAFDAPEPDKWWSCPECETQFPSDRAQKFGWIDRGVCDDCRPIGEDAERSSPRATAPDPDEHDDDDDDDDDEIRWNASAEASLVYKGLCETLDRWQGDLRPLEETLSQVLRTVRERMKEAS
jgi:hypothetical protein